MEQVILVDEQDNVIGSEEKLKAHREGLLHRAISVFIFDSQGRLLLQQRAANKYHSGGLWTNTCCSHPRPDESTQQAAERRLKEEMGIECALKEAFDFTYFVSFPDGLSEHELDHVFTGTWEGTPQPAPTEVQDWKWALPADLLQDVKAQPMQYTYWFTRIIERVLAELESNSAAGGKL